MGAISSFRLDLSSVSGRRISSDGDSSGYITLDWSWRMVLLVGLLRGNAALDPLIGIASVVIGASVVLFAINVFQNVRG